MGVCLELYKPKPGDTAALQIAGRCTPWLCACAKPHKAAYISYLYAYSIKEAHDAKDKDKNVFKWPWPWPCVYFEEGKVAAETTTCMLRLKR